jgi:hypothetical protein
MEDTQEKSGAQGEPLAKTLREPKTALQREIRLMRLLAFFMQEIQDSRKPMRPDAEMSVPDHECGFLTHPEAGYCAFCDSWGEAFEALEAGSTPAPSSEPVERSGAEPLVKELVGLMRDFQAILEGKDYSAAQIASLRKGVAAALQRAQGGAHG